MRLLSIISLSLSALSANADTWRMGENSILTFESTFEGSPLPGHFRHFDVSLDFDPANPCTGHLVVSVDLASADMDDPDINAAIAEPAWFDVAGFPQAVFDGAKIVAETQDAFVASGELILKGVSRVVEVPFTWSESGNSGEMRGEFTLRRSDFDIGSGEWSSGEQIGIDVRLQFSVHLERDE